jgi:hypothetical protein
MKVGFGFAIFVALSALAADAAFPETPAAASNQVEPSYPRLGRFQLWVNPFSTFTMGPSAGFSFVLGDTISLGALLRARGLGLVTRMATLYTNEPGSGLDFRVLPYSTDACIEVSRLFVSPRRDSLVRVGIETGIGLAWTEAIYDPSWSAYSYKSYDGFAMLLVLGAVRWRYPSGFYLELGGRLGIQVAVWQASSYLDRPQVVYRSAAPELYPAGSLDVAVGIELARK